MTASLRRLPLLFLAAMPSLSCAPIDLRPPAEIEAERAAAHWVPPGDQPTTPVLLDELMASALEYRSERASTLASQAYAKRVMETRDRTATRDNPYAPAFGSLNRAMGAVAYQKATVKLVELDQAWHRLLFEVLGNAPSVPDFDMRAVALGLSPDESRPFWHLFQLAQEPR